MLSLSFPKVRVNALAVSTDEYHLEQVHITQNASKITDKQINISTREARHDSFHEGQSFMQNVKVARRDREPPPKRFVNLELKRSLQENTRTGERLSRDHNHSSSMTFYPKPNQPV